LPNLPNELSHLSGHRGKPGKLAKQATARTSRPIIKVWGTNICSKFTFKPAVAKKIGAKASRYNFQWFRFAAKAARLTCENTKHKSTQGCF